MSLVATKKTVVDKIISEVKKLDSFEQENLLIKVRLKNYLNEPHEPIANYDMTKIKPPTMAQIDKWKHDSRAKK